MHDLLDEIKSSLLELNEEKVVKAVKKCLEVGNNPIEIVNAISSALKEIGDKFGKGELFLPDLMIAGEVSKKVISEHIGPLLKQTKAVKKRGVFVIGSVAGDIHDIGKNIVASMLFADGFEVIDLGVDISVDKFVQAVKEYSPDILGMSALLTSTREVQKEVIEALKKHGLRGKVKVMVGGGAASSEWAQEIGADGYAEDAIEAVKVARRLLEGQR
ncbi:MAG: corrinoid protein [Nitrososphaeria archaeon]